MTADVVPFSGTADAQSVRESILFISDVWDESNCDLERFQPAPPPAAEDEAELLGSRQRHHHGD